MSATTSYDVAIVGGGVAGCYAAYRLMTAKPEDFKPNSPLLPILKQNGKLNVGLFEYSGRMGGRLLSVKVPIHSQGNEGAFDYYAEFGGFRFNRQMQIVWDTAQHLNLNDQPFSFQEPQNLVYVRGQQLRQEQVDRGQDLPYNLTPTERGKSPSELSDLVANTAIPGFSDLRTQFHTVFNSGDWTTVAHISNRYEQLKQTSTVNNRSLKDWSWWALKRYVLSQEAVELLEDTGGYDSQGSAGTVATNLDETFYFPDSSGPLSQGINTEWRHIKEGYSAIPDGLFEGFKAQGGQGFIMHQLLRFDKAPDGGYTLRFFKREAGSNEPPSVVEGGNHPDKIHEVKAQFLILSMPKRSLELLEQNSFFFQDANVMGLLNTVDTVNAIRIYLAYPNPWWQEKYPEITKGRSTTDLGIRQFYYWFTESGSQPNALVLASYSNGPAEVYWRSLQGGKNFDEFHHGAVNHNTTPVANQGPGPRHASVTMAEQAHQQLMQVHGVSDAQLPYYAHFQNWSKDPFGGGWHSWQAGYDEADLIPKLRQPMPSEQIYIAGECWSNVQGWVWGALNSSEAVLQCNLGLTWPSWLRKHGTWLGPGTQWLVGDETDPCQPS